uniref:Pentatricopeptide repeat-containing protein n=1 Tax=Caenorhabditis tropicalis TaxID=1561998 RepID=A0A1I7TPB6_9PELO
MLAHMDSVLARVKMQTIGKYDFVHTSLLMSDLDSNCTAKRLLEILNNDADTITMYYNRNMSVKPQWDDSQKFFNKMLYNRFNYGQDCLLYLVYFL